MFIVRYVIFRKKHVCEVIYQRYASYAQGCLKEWIKRSDGKACPICRYVSLSKLFSYFRGNDFITEHSTLIIPEQLQRVSMKEKELETAKEDKKVEVPRSRRVIEYNTIDNDVLQKIQKIDCLGSFGSKIETLVKHILYLEDVDPGCKSIIFSAWADSLFSKQHYYSIYQSDQTSFMQFLSVR